jgi:hypothetical protein
MRSFPFWHHALEQHPAHGAITFDPAAAFGAAVCLLLIAVWGLAQLQSRCGECSAVPARCRCAREHARRR